MNADRQAPKYRIGMVAKLTGISSHQLRIWERRYQTVTPARSAGGDRLYSDADVAKLRQLKQLVAVGHSIGHVARMSGEDLAELLDEQLPAPPDPDGSLLANRVSEQFLSAITQLKVVDAERALGQASSAFTPDRLVSEVMLPILHEVGRRWASGELSIAQEHAASAVLRTQLGALLRLYSPNTDAPVAVSGTLAHEMHELGALAAALSAASRGWKVVYLGPSLPARELSRTVTRSKAEILMLSVVVLQPGMQEELAALLGQIPPGVRVLIGGAGARSLRDLPDSVLVLDTIEELDRAL